MTNWDQEEDEIFWDSDANALQESIAAEGAGEQLFSFPVVPTTDWDKEEDEIFWDSDADALQESIAAEGAGEQLFSFPAVPTTNWDKEEDEIFWDSDADALQESIAAEGASEQLFSFPAVPTTNWDQEEDDETFSDLDADVLQQSIAAEGPSEQRFSFPAVPKTNWDQEEDDEMFWDFDVNVSQESIAVLDDGPEQTHVMQTAGEEGQHDHRIYGAHLFRQEDHQTSLAGDCLIPSFPAGSGEVGSDMIKWYDVLMSLVTTPPLSTGDLHNLPMNPHCSGSCTASGEDTVARMPAMVMVGGGQCLPCLPGDQSSGPSVTCDPKLQLDNQKPCDGLNGCGAAPHPRRPSTNKAKTRRVTRKELCETSRTFSVETDDILLGDGYTWKKYGKKAIKGMTFPREYYKCVEHDKKGCKVRKWVQQHAVRGGGGPQVVHFTYIGKHNHPLAGEAHTIER